MSFGKWTVRTDGCGKKFTFKVQRSFHSNQSLSVYVPVAGTLLSCWGVPCSGESRESLSIAVTFCPHPGLLERWSHCRLTDRLGWNCTDRWMIRIYLHTPAILPEVLLSILQINMSNALAVSQNKPRLVPCILYSTICSYLTVKRNVVSF